MKVRNSIKLFLVLGILFALLLIIPSAEAVPLSETDNTANFYGIRLREGGAESSGTLTEEQQLLYDTSRYKYDIGDNETFKIVEAQDGENYSNALFCLDANKSLASNASESLEYTNCADFFDSTDANVKSLYFGTSFSDDPVSWRWNYSDLSSLLKCLYLEKQSPEAKDMILKAYTEYLNDNGIEDITFEEVKALLTDDDIDVAQQYAIWHFTNGDEINYEEETLYSIDLTTEDDQNGSYTDITGDMIRQELISNYSAFLIDLATSYSSDDLTYPSISYQSTASSLIENNYYKMGPFEVVSGNINKNYYDIKLIDQNGNEINRDDYIIKINDTVVDYNVDDDNMFDKEYYVYIPISNNDITQVTLSLTYREYETTARLWKTTVASDSQEILLLTQEGNDVEESQTFNIEQIGKYNIQVIKVDANDNTRLENAKFDIKVGSMSTVTDYTDENGLIEINNIDISNTSTETILIEEKEAPTSEYQLLSGTLMIEINKGIEDNKYKVTSINVVSPVNGISVVFDKANQLITVTAQNTKETTVENGSYELEIIKTDESGNTITDGTAKFGISINGGSQSEITTSLGIGSYGNINITTETSDTITITENEPPEGYAKLIDSLTLTVNKEIVSNRYAVSSINLTGENGEATLSGNKITVKVKNQKEETPPAKTGNYELEIVKTDESWNRITEGTAKFNVKVNSNAETEITTTQGTANFGTIAITDVSANDTIKITETEAPSGYNKLIEEIQLSVEKEETVAGYRAKTVTLTGSEKARATLSGNKITVEVQNQKKTGNYELEIQKVNEEGNIITEGIAKFSVKVNDRTASELTTNQGITNFGSVLITDVSTPDTIIIEENSAPDGYSKLIGSIKINVNKTEKENSLSVTSVSISNGNANAEYDSDNNKIIIKVQNQKKTGNYELEIVKTDESWNKIIEAAKFNVKVDSNGETEISTTQGIANFGTIAITDVSANDTIKITETEAPSGYKKLIEEIQLSVEKEETETEYRAKTVTLTGSEKARATLSGNKITVEVQNQKKTGNYELEIQKVNEEGNIITEGTARFNVKVNSNEETEVTTTQGTANFGTIAITDVSANDTIKITETEAPSGYNKLVEEIQLSVEKEETETRYGVKEVLLNGDENVTANVEGNRIIVKIKNSKIKGAYNIEISKINKKNSEEKIENVLFGIKIGNKDIEEYVTNVNGIIYIPNIPIYSLETETITIYELETTDEYELLEEPLEITINKSLQDGKYIISDINSTENDFFEAELENDTIKAIVKNDKKILGYYDLDIIKTDEENNILTECVTDFKINDEEKQTENGLIKYENIKIDKNNVDKNDVYIIKELNTGENYIKFNEQIKLIISKKLSIDETKYEINDIQLEVENENGDIIDGSQFISVDMQEKDGKEIIELKIKNYEILDFSLRKYISAVSSDEVFTEDEVLTGKDSREPQVDLTKLDNKEKTTANYNHTKEELEVSKDSYILYKIRVYNEGNKAGYVTKVIDYIPDELEFVSSHDKNNIWSFDENTNTITTNENYIATLLEKHSEGEALYYQDLDVVLQVKEDCPKDINIVNIAKIEEIKHKDGTIGEDRDNIDAFKYPDDIYTYNGGLDEDLEDNYIPGQEDTDDFDKIVVLDYEHVDLALRKYISAVSQDEIFENDEYLTGERSREPIVDISSLDNREKVNSLKTAIYNHSKSTVSVKANDYVLYKMRIYNEGNINGKATVIKDYLPESLEFIENLDNNIWTYNQEEHSVTTNENYEPKVLTRHYKGQELDYQEIEIICKVKDDAEEDINIVNIAEIIESEDEFGNIFDDRDNKERLTYPIEVSNYNGAGVEGNYIHGQEDDDDFDRVMIKSLYGEYDIQIIKTDELGNIISDSTATFVINEEEKETENGVISFNNIGINKSNLGIIEKYEITEKNISNNYTKFDGKIILEIAKRISDDGTKYEIDSSNTKITILDKDNVEQNDKSCAELEIEKDEEKTIIKLKIKNYEKVDLSLRKYVSAVSIDEKFETKEYLSREPIIDLTSLDNKEKTTAKYNHSKEKVAVRPNDYVLYKLRVYNEGNKPAYASIIKDYIPEGLEFVKNLEQNNIWNYDAETNTITTNDNYRAKLIEEHSIGKQLDYQELEVVLRVKNNVEENIRIVNIAEIIERKYADGLVAIDIDNTDTVLYPDSISEYYGGEDIDKSDNFIPGQEDDDDFDSIIVNTLLGQYTLEIQKVNKEGMIINNSRAIFEINEILEYTKNGIIDIGNIEINKSNIEKPDLFKIIELKAPDGYKEIDGTINVVVSKRESADRTKYEPYKITAELEKTNGEKTIIRNVELKNENDKTKVIVKVENEEKAKEQIVQNLPNNNSNIPNNPIIINGGNSNNENTKQRNVITNIKVSDNNSTSSNSNSVTKTSKVNPNTGDNTLETIYNIIYIVLFINIILIAVEKKIKDE